MTIESITEEIWKPIPGFEATYAASTLGRIMRIRSGTRNKSGHIMKMSKTKGGYATVKLREHGRYFQSTLQRVIAMTFIGPPPTPKSVVNHKNFVRDDNRPENLEWCTYAQNIRYSRNNGRMVTDKLDEKKVKEILNLVAYGIPVRSIARDYGITKGLVYFIVRGVAWSEVEGHRPTSILSGRGERLPQSKLTPEKVIEIRNLRESGLSYPSIAQRFGVCFQSIYDICKRRTWKHVP